MTRGRITFWLIALLGSIVAIYAVWPTVERLVTPGPLSRAHAALDDRCERCHVAFTQVAQDRLCSSCHKDVAKDIAANVGFHGRAPQVRQAECRTCHGEHKGRDVDLADLKRGRFDHQLGDFPLLGKHRGLACASCHANGAAFRAAPGQCIDCHREDDVHRGRFGTSCASCHNADGWTIIRQFDHRMTGFPLLGAHGTVACQSCHAGNRFAGTPRTCIGCHAKDDAHQGRFGRDCAQCHNPVSWKGATFNHAITRFPLTGAHARTACAACHGARGERPKPPLTCIGCHAKNDIHAGRFGTNCAQCHSTASWKGARFNHNLTRFPLAGAHERVACAACHGARNERPKPPLTCIGCHAKNDVHRGALGTACAYCHDVVRWKNVPGFSHGRTAFPLTGAHVALACASCHRDQRFTAAGRQCAACHADTHHRGAFGAPANCAACHGTARWKGAVFDHAATGFPLRGKHGRLPCAACHGKGTPKKLATSCVSCHRADDPHGGRFGDRCATCHTSFESFKTVRVP